MDKSTAENELNAILTEVHSKVKEACKIADKHGLSFTLDYETYVGTKQGKRLTVQDYWDGTAYYELEEDDPRYDEDEEYSGWQNSSTFC